jgi:hypothetical protein
MNMNHYDLTPNAAERYFDSSIFGQLFTSMAEALGHRLRGQESHRRGANPTRSAKPGLLERLDRWFTGQEQKAREDYLATSADVFELERRIAALERGLISRFD